MPEKAGASSSSRLTSDSLADLKVYPL